MAAFTVNGRPVTVENNRTLIHFLRADLGLGAVNDGLQEGVRVT